MYFNLTNVNTSVLEGSGYGTNQLAIPVQLSQPMVRRSRWGQAAPAGCRPGCCAAAATSKS